MADSALELTFAEEVSESQLDGLILLHDGVEETGRLVVEGKIARYWPDNGWFVGVTYEVRLSGVVDSLGKQVLPWSFTTGTWRQLDAAPSCTESVRHPVIAAAQDNSVSLFGSDSDDGLRSCLMRWNHEALWQPARVLPGNALFDKRLFPANDQKAGLALGIATESRTLIVSTTSGDPLLEQPMVASYAADRSASGKGLIVWSDDEPFDDHLRVRRVDEAAIGEPDVLFESSDRDISLSDFAAAAGDNGGLAVAWVRTSIATDLDTIFLATSDGTSPWETREIKTVPIFSDGVSKYSVVSAFQLSIADDGRIFLVWQQTTGFATGDGEIWGASYDESVVSDRRLADSSSLPPVLVSNGAHTAAVWADAAGDARQLVVLRVREGGWDSTIESSAELAPSSDLDAAIDAVGNVVFTWMEGTTLCAGRHRESSWERQCGFLPQPSFTSPIASIEVTDRGRAFLAWFGGDAVELATFD